MVFDEATEEYIVIPCRGEYDDELAEEVFDYVNEIRRQHGVDELEWEFNLEIAAKMRALETTFFFSHTRPNGADCFSLKGSMVKI